MDDAINAKYGKRLAERGHRVFSQVGPPRPTSRFNGANSCPKALCPPRRPCPSAGRHTAAVPKGLLRWVVQFEGAEIVAEKYGITRAEVREAFGCVCFARLAARLFVRLMAVGFSF